MQSLLPKVVSGYILYWARAAGVSWGNCGFTPCHWAGVSGASCTVREQAGNHMGQGGSLANDWWELVNNGNRRC